MSMRTMPSAWETARLVVRDVAPEEAPLIHALASACADVAPWDPTFAPLPDDAEHRLLVERSLSPVEEGTPPFRLQTIRLRDGAPIGYYHLVHGGPEPEDAWISMLLIHPDHQGKGYGEELVERLAGLLGELGYRAIKLDVYLRNWPALRFWTVRGFDTVVAVLGDRAHQEGAHARLRLRRGL